VVVRVLGREILFGTRFHFSWWLVDKIVMEWTTMHDAMFIGKANGFVSPNVWWFFFGDVDSVHPLAWKRLRNSIALVLQFPWMSKVLTQDQAQALWIYFHFLLAICVRAHTIFYFYFISLCSCLWTRFTRKKTNFMYKSIYYIPHEKKKVNKINHKHANS
jgi:hypothetical protein